MKKRTSIPLFLLTLFLTGNLVNTGWTMNVTSPKVAVSITPFYALVAALMEGVGTPELLVKPGSSPHQYSLKPKDVKVLNKADLIFWGGPDLETFLVKPLQNLKEEKPHTKRIVQLNKTLGLMLLPIRHSAAWDPHNHGEHLEHHHTSHSLDMHFWLDIDNAIVITDTMAHSLITLDPKHAAQYRKNAENLKHKLIALDYQIRKKLESVKQVPFIVFHDAYQYFERQYGLNGAGSITLHPEIPPSAKRLQTIRAIILKTKAKCVFIEPQFESKLIKSITEDLPVNVGKLDPIGNQTENNPEGYFKLLENLTNSMTACLK